MKFLASCLRSLPWLMALLLVAVAGGCGGGGMDSGTGSASGSGSAGATMGTLGVSLTDMPACGFDAVNVTVRKVRVHQSSSASDTDGGWTDITLNPAQKINLLDLTNGVLLESRANTAGGGALHANPPGAGIERDDAPREFDCPHGWG